MTKLEEVLRIADELQELYNKAADRHQAKLAELRTSLVEFAKIEAQAHEGEPPDPEEP